MIGHREALPLSRQSGVALHGERCRRESLRRWVVGEEVALVVEVAREETTCLRRRRTKDGDDHLVLVPSRVGRDGASTIALVGHHEGAVVAHTVIVGVRTEVGVRVLAVSVSTADSGPDAIPEPDVETVVSLARASGAISISVAVLVAVPPGVQRDVGAEVVDGLVFVGVQVDVGPAREGTGTSVPAIGGGQLSLRSQSSRSRGDLRCREVLLSTDVLKERDGVRTTKRWTPHKVRRVTREGHACLAVNRRDAYHHETVRSHLVDRVARFDGGIGNGHRDR